MQAETIIRGKVYVLKDNIDTDQIIPAIYLNLVPTIPEEYSKLGSYALSGLPEDHEPFIAEGSHESEFRIIIAGSNFGCGSSREHAPIALGAAGVNAVIAESYARIFFRNSVATGELYPLESEERLCDIFSTGDEVEILPGLNEIRHSGSGHSFKLKPLGAVAPIIQAGGIFEYARVSGMIPAKPGTDGQPARTERTSSKTKVIAVANQKGGVGKTTSIVNLAAGLQALKQKVLVVDMDPQANTTSGLGLNPEQGVSLYQLFLTGGNIQTMIRKTSIKGLDIIPSELDLAGAEVDVARMDEYLHKFRNLLTPVLNDETYDFVLLDCPPSLGILTMNALTAADSVIFPIQCEYYALEGLSVISDLVDQLRESGSNPDIEIEGILMTMFDSRTKLATDVVNEVRKHFETKVYKTIIPRNVRLSEAPSFGQPVIQYAKHSSGARAYTKFAKEFLKRTRSK
ncbi:MAG: AAA family ATPase [Kiritimatiellae bacterium]|nr:AAA family ATPase [Kiritimatiellia bacterium]